MNARPPDYWGSLISGLCRDRSVSVRALSEQAKVNRTSLRRFMAGGSFRVSHLERVLAVFGYELDAFLVSDRQNADREGE